ncbi:hypothetical protein BPUM_2970 [Bacillus pumilus SAFR-032]|uniref:Uncharacterized protein n=1 Tax=Bacillus pumilus (strain SAFR-032) TaxID=315750 RepID=A8FHA7_BACP2|nr:hypothetical protein BPUM_2970 [Bacillus pumilus SAFR-032]
MKRIYLFNFETLLIKPSSFPLNVLNDETSRFIIDVSAFQL